MMCLKTCSKNVPLNASKSLASKLDDFWLKIRISELEVLASHLLINGQPKESSTSYAPKLSNTLKKYYWLKGAGRSKQFYAAANRNIGYVIEYLGNRPLNAYSTADVASFRDWLLERLRSTSIPRIFSIIRAAINLTIYEDKPTLSIAFAKTFLSGKERPKRA